MIEIGEVQWARRVCVAASACGVLQPSRAQQSPANCPCFFILPALIDCCAVPQMLQPLMPADHSSLPLHPSAALTPEAIG